MFPWFPTVRTYFPETLILARTCQDLSARRLSIQQCQGNAPSIGRTSGERGRKYTLGRRDSKPSVGLVLKRSSTRGYTAEYPTDIKRLATSSSPRGERVQQVQRRCPWARAMIASPYIRQLRYGLPLCCIHGQSRGKDGAHLHNGRSEERRVGKE